MTHAVMSAEGGLLAYPFRLFFLLTSGFTAVAMALWLAALSGYPPLVPVASPSTWHAHEMLYGLVVAAIAGFLLTAMTSWTGAAPLRGQGLAALALVWLAGRTCNLLAPPLLALLADQLFLLSLAVYVAQVLWRHQSRRNTVLALGLFVLAGGDAVVHAGLLLHDGQLSRMGLVLGFDVITLLMVIIGGRIIPLFTNNWLRARDATPAARIPLAALELGAIISVVVLAAASLLPLHPAVVAVAAGTAAVLNGWRLLRWRGWRTAAEPLLWSLHVAYAFIVVALLLRAVSAVHGLAIATLWQHALGVGGIGLMILAVMTRVSLGHTGRAMVLPRGMALAYWALIIAALMRVGTAITWIPATGGLLISGSLWIAAYASFVIFYWPVLSRPREDGKPG